MFKFGVRELGPASGLDAPTAAIMQTVSTQSTAMSASVDPDISEAKVLPAVLRRVATALPAI